MLNFALKIAAEVGNTYACQLAIDSGANDVDWVLRASVREGYAEMARLAIRHGASVNWMVTQAVEYGRMDFVELARELGARNSFDMIRFAIALDKIEFVGYALQWCRQDGGPWSFEEMRRAAINQGKYAVYKMLRPIDESARTRPIFMAGPADL